MSKISVVINTWNEEKNLPRALSSVKDFANEIIVCDMESDDKTVEIAKKSGAKVYNHKKTNYVEPARNYAVSKATGDWILVLDADEELTQDLKLELKKIEEEDKVDYVKLPRKNIVFGKWLRHSRFWPDYLIRFFKKGSVSWSDIIHLEPEVKGNGIDLDAKEENAIIHYHYESVEQFVERLNRYTTVQSKLLKDSSYKFSWQDLIKKPTNEFLSRYFLGQGYKDGIHGLALAGLQALSELVLYLKVWQLEGFQEEEVKVNDVISEMRKAEKDFHYWQADALYKEKGTILQKVKRKFKLP